MSKKTVTVEVIYWVEFTDSHGDLIQANLSQLQAQELIEKLTDLGVE